MTDYASVTELSHIPHAYLPQDKVEQTDAGKKVGVSLYTKNIMNKFNLFVKEIAKLPVWIENRAHSNGAFTVVDGQYQVSASCCYVTKDEPRIFTVKLYLDKQNEYEPTKFIIDIRNPTLPAPIEPFEYNVGIEYLEINTPTHNAKIVHDLVLRMIESLDLKVAAKTGTTLHADDAKEMIIADYDFDLDFIKRRLMPFAADEMSNLELVGCSADDGETPLLYVSYTTNEGTGIHEIKFSDYLDLKFAH